MAGNPESEPEMRSEGQLASDLPFLKQMPEVFVLGAWETAEILPDLIANTAESSKALLQLALHGCRIIEAVM